MKRKVTIELIIFTIIISLVTLIVCLHWDKTTNKPTITKKTVKPSNLISQTDIEKFKAQVIENLVIMKATKKSVTLELKQDSPPNVENKTPVQSPKPPTSQAISSKRLNWGFKTSTNGNPPGINENFKTILSRFNGIYLDNSGSKSVYLTFDEGYENGFTPIILDVLRNQQVPAAFFVTGSYVDNNPDYVKRMVQEGHIIGNHTWHHYNLSDISIDEVRTELDYVRNELIEILGPIELTYMRPPAGAFSEVSLDIANQMGYQSVFWSVAYKDWVTTEQQGAQHAYDSVMPQIHPGAIILLHAVSKDNTEALDKIITDLKAQGYTFKSLDQFEK